MTGIQQQIASFGFVAAYDRVAAKKVHVDGFLDNQFRARCFSNGLLATMKAFVVKENFESHYQ